MASKINSSAQSQVTSQQAMKWLIWGGALTGLFFYTNLNDPINAPKSWILNIAGFWLMGWVLFQVKSTFKVVPLKWASIISFAYLLALTVAFIATDNKYQGFFGDYARRTGYLSYLSLVFIFLAAAYLFDLSNLNFFARAVIIIGFIEGLYGNAQHFKFDFVNWNNPYNSVIATLGNPDFAAAFMSIFLVLNFGIALPSRNPKWLRAIAALNVILQLTAIVFSHVRQGLLTAVTGVVLIIIVWLNQRNKMLARILAGLSVVGGFFGVIGMLNKGPLSRYFYKVSVTYRGDYWRAGWRMFIHHPIFGVGLDRYGSYFRQYRDNTQSMRRGPNVVSNAAHSVPIQLLSTGGIFVFITFLLFVGFILWRGIVGLRKTTGSSQLSIAVIFAAWIAYQLQSLISIDNLGIAIWGYLLGGAVVGVSLIDGDRNKTTVNKSYTQPIVSIALALVAFVISGFLYQSESAMRTFSQYQVPKSGSNTSQYETLANKPLSYHFIEPSFEVTIAGNLAQANDFPKAIALLQKVNASDHESYDSLELLARIYEFQRNWSGAIALRERIKVIDPFNPDNLKQLAADQKSA
jgi:O-antigen ligase